MRGESEGSIGVDNLKVILAAVEGLRISTHHTDDDIARVEKTNECQILEDD